MKNPKIFLGLVACLLIIGSLGFSGSGELFYIIKQQNNGPWSIPKAISDPQVSAWFPDIIADSTGRIHLVWSGGTTGYDEVIYSTSTNGVDWSKPNDILAIPQKVSGESGVSRPALWMNREGLLISTYGSINTFYSQAPLSEAGSASAWAQPVLINGNQISYFSRIVEDEKGVLHVIYTENHPTNFCNICFHLYYRRSNDHGHSWTDPVDISVEDNGAAKPQMIIDPKGNLYVVWEAGPGGSLGAVEDPTLVKFTASYDGGKTWTPPIQLSPPDVAKSKNVTISLDAKGALIVVWLDPSVDEVFYQTSTDHGKSWSNAEQIQGIYGAWNIYPSFKDDYSTAVDSQGNVHLLMVGKVRDYQESLSLIHVSWDGSSWSSPDEITRMVGDVPEWPRITVSLGNVLNATWFVRDQANIWKSDTGHYRVWYSRKEISAPALPTSEPKIATTPSPVPTTESTAASVQTPDAGITLATLAPQDKKPANGIYSENDYVKVMAFSIIPVVLFIIIAGVVIFVRRS